MELSLDDVTVPPKPQFRKPRMFSELSPGEQEVMHQRARNRFYGWNEAEIRMVMRGVEFMQHVPGLEIREEERVFYQHLLEHADAALREMHET